MTESFLHYIWQFQYFNKKHLVSADGEEINVFNPGIRNTNAGPDFSNARISIGTLEWRGSVELHIKSSGWTDHHHSDDAAYEKVILHVVWENDQHIVRSDGSLMPTLELKDRVDLSLWESYRKLFTSGDPIPCTGQWPSVSSLVKMSMLDKVLAQRLELKAQRVMGMLKENMGDWEETCYQLLLSNFGFKVNTDAFSQLSRILPYHVIRKHRDQQLQVEALLFGAAGFLATAHHDDYGYQLAREYAVLSKKFNLSEKQLHESQWRFLRLRPANFPTVRLAQLAALLTTNTNLFSSMIHTESVKDILTWLQVPQSDYWQNHYQLGKAAGLVPAFGKSSAENVIINTVVPMLAAYSLSTDDQHYMDRALALLQQLPAEKNVITRQWKELGQNVKTAFDSQALIELHNNFCMKRRCLECSVGATIIKPLR
ncbi:MAG: DUF2851 family protein [Cyclobacteriaceae bacterium]|nr:DUF2851 family protein [Cyclobacteriaceae bacterium]